MMTKQRDRTTVDVTAVLSSQIEAAYRRATEHRYGENACAGFAIAAGLCAIGLGLADIADALRSKREADGGGP